MAAPSTGSHSSHPDNDITGYIFYKLFFASSDVGAKNELNKQLFEVLILSQSFKIPPQLWYSGEWFLQPAFFSSVSALH